MILPKFRETLLVFPKFRRVNSFAKEISRNFVSYLFCEMIQPKSREISRNSFCIPRNFVALLVSRKKIPNFVKYKFREMIFPKFRETLFVFREISSCYQFREKNSRNFVKYLIREMIFPKFREISRNTFCISRNFVVLLVLRKKFHEISSNTYFAK